MTEQNQPDSGTTNPPPAQTPPPEQPAQKPPVVVQPQNNAEIMNAINSLPEKLGDVFKEMFPKTPEPPTAPENQPPTTPPASPANPPAPEAAKPAPRRGLANWYFGNK